MYVPPFPLQKRQSDVPPHSDNLFPNVDNNVALIVGVSLAVAAILALLLGGLIKRYRLRHSSSTSASEPPPGETQPPTRQPSFSQPQRPSNAGSDNTEFTLCDEPVDLEKANAKELNGGHVALPQPPSILNNSPRPPSTLSVATTLSQHIVKPERSSRWQSIAQRVDEKAGTSESKRVSTALSFSPVPPSPRTPTSPSSPIRIPSPVSLKDSKLHIHGSN